MTGGSAGRPIGSRSERRRAGRLLRQKVPRSSHAAWLAPTARDDPLEILARADRGRLPRLLPIRYGRMSISPFTFLRGAAGVMAHDLAHTPRTGLEAQLCGDAHLNNFGMFATPERAQVFDINDFDETLRGPWEWDVKRLATSVVLAGRQNGAVRPFTRNAARRAVRAYRRAMGQFASMRYDDIWYFHLDPSAARPAPPTSRKLLERAARRARRGTSLHAFPRMAEAAGGRFRIRDARPLIVHYRDDRALEESRAFFERYRATLPDERRMLLDRYHVVDSAQKVVGVGSVGLTCAVLLLVGDPDVPDPLFLQLKEATASALEEVLGRAPYENHAERVVVGQHMVQEASDVFLGWSRHRGRDFYVRQLRDMKFSYDLSTLGPGQFVTQAELCGTALARAHARTGDPAGIGGYLGSGAVFDESVARFAEAYADQTEQDFRQLRTAIRRGRLPATVDA
jgi:uncharacterized protein (DUF2252 family)